MLAQVVILTLCACLWSGSTDLVTTANSRQLVKYCVWNLTLSVTNSSSRRIGRVHGGTKLRTNDFPYAVLIYINALLRPNPYCSGTMITNLVVLTVAACTEDDLDVEAVDVVAGLVDIQELDADNVPAEIQAQCGIKKYVNHPEFRFGKFEHDLSLFFMRGPFVTTAAVAPVAIAHGRFPARGELCRVMGWGSSENQPFGMFPSWTSMWVRKPYLGCVPPGKVAERNLCAKGERRSHVCDADFGGPLVCQGLLTGVVTGTHNPLIATLCNHSLTTTVSIHVAKYLHWFKQHVPDILPPVDLNAASLIHDGRRCLLLDGLAVGVCMSRYIW